MMIPLEYSDVKGSSTSWGKASFVFLALEYLQTHGPPKGVLVWKGVG
jgi:hypothetical protein